MSYALSSALQSAVYDLLRADPALGLVIGPHVYDALPSASVPATYVLLGPERVRDASDQTEQGAVHDFVVSVVSTASGFAEAKQAAAAICDCLAASQPTLSRGYLTGLSFLKAEATRSDTSGVRRINLVFRARVGGA